MDDSRNTLSRPVPAIAGRHRRHVGFKAPSRPNTIVRVDNPFVEPDDGRAAPAATWHITHGEGGVG